MSCFSREFISTQLRYNTFSVPHVKFYNERHDPACLNTHTHTKHISARVSVFIHTYVYVGVYGERVCQF